MATIITAQAAPQTTEDYEAAFERLMAEAESIDERMRLDRVDIERLEAQTQETIKDIARLKVETRSLLVSMGAKL